jgi:hypothetical protein
MKTRCDGRIDVLIDALCALAEALPADAKQAVSVALVRRVATRSLDDEATDAAVACDVSRVLDALGCLPRGQMTARA